MSTVTTNTLWNEYLRSLGYSGSINDMMIKALREFTGSGQRDVNTLWDIYFTMREVPGRSTQDRFYNYLGSKGYTSISFDTRVRMSLIAGDILEDRADKEALEQALAAASMMDEDDYTPESWAVLAAAVAHGQELLGDRTASQEEVNDAAQAIVDAISDLVPVTIECLIPLSGDVAPTLGLVPAKVSGHRVYIDEVPTDHTVYGAFSNLDSPHPVLPGIQLTEMTYEWAESDRTVSPNLVLASEDLSKILVASWGTEDDFFIFMQGPDGLPINDTIVSIEDIQGAESLAISINGTTGEVEAYVSGVPQGLSTILPFYADTFLGVSALHSGATIDATPGVTVPYGVVMSVSADTMFSQYPTGLIDRCGNAI